jgi:hypothetical protein
MAKEQDSYLSLDDAAKKYKLTVGTIRTYCSKRRVMRLKNTVSEASLVAYLERRNRRPTPCEQPRMVRTVDAIRVQLKPAARARFWENLNAIAYIPTTNN